MPSVLCLILSRRHWNMIPLSLSWNDIKTQEKQVTSGFYPYTWWVQFALCEK